MTHSTEVPSEHKSEPATPDTTYGISLSSFAAYLRSYTFDGTKNEYGEPARPGDIAATQAGRELWSPIVLEYVTDRTISSLPGERLLDAPIVVEESKAAHAALTDMLQSRRTREGKDRLKERTSTLLQQARERRTFSPLVDAAISAQQEFRSSEIGTLAGDVVLALGKISLSERMQSLYIVAPDEVSKGSGEQPQRQTRAGATQTGLSA